METAELDIVPAADHAHIETLTRVDNPWAEFESQIPLLETTAGTIIVTKDNYLVQSDIARSIRLKAKATRVAIEHRREELVKDLNERTKSINGAAKLLKDRLEEMEGKLLEQEKFAEREAARIKTELTAARSEALKPFGVDPSFYSLGDMPETVWQQLLDNSKLAHETKLEQARKAEEQRIADENARLKREAEEAAERERLKAENERLRKEAEEREQKARVEREAAESKLREQQQKADRERREQEEIQRKERERIQAEADADRERIELAAKKEREAREKLEQENREREAKEKAEAERVEAEKLAAAKAPDREKLTAFAKSLSALELPTMATEAGNLAHDKINHQIQGLAKWIIKTAEAM